MISIFAADAGRMESSMAYVRHGSASIYVFGGIRRSGAFRQRSMQCRRLQRLGCLFELWGY